MDELSAVAVVFLSGWLLFRGIPSWVRFMGDEEDRVTGRYPTRRIDTEHIRMVKIKRRPQR